MGWSGCHRLERILYWQIRIEVAEGYPNDKPLEIIFNGNWRYIIWLEKVCVGRICIILGQFYKEGTKYRING